MTQSNKSVSHLFVSRGFTSCGVYNHTVSSVAIRLVRIDSYYISLHLLGINSVRL